MKYINHAFVSNIPDDADTSLVRPSNWNARLQYGSTASVVPDGTDALIRGVLTATTTYYVRTDGNDSNDGLSDTAAGAFATVQHALDVIYGLDINSQSLRLHIGTGNWSNNGAPFIVNQRVGETGSSMYIIGNGSSNTSISLWAQGYGGFFLQSITIDAAMGDGFAGLYVGEHCEVVVLDSDVLFATSAGGVDIYAYDYGAFSVNTDYKISGTKAAHFTGGAFGKYAMLADHNITLIGGPNINHFFDIVDDMIVYWRASTSSGAMTGAQFHIDGLNCTIQGTLANIPGTAGVYTATRETDYKSWNANAQLTATTFVNLPTPVAGMLRYVSDSTTVVWGATITGGSTNHVLAWYNGTNWTVAGK